jgi:rubredoxin
MEITIKKAPGGFLVDGLEIKGGKCGCTSVLPCCYSWAKVKRSGDAIVFTAKASTPETKDNFTWGYTVKKGNFSIDVTFDDARDKTIYSGFYPPRLEEWVARGWEVASKKGERADGTLWRCAACKWLYKDDLEAVKFEDLPSDWLCPVCRATKDVFENIG